MQRAGLRRVLAAVGATAGLALAATVPVLAAGQGAGAQFYVTATFEATMQTDTSCGAALHVTATGTTQGTHVGSGLWSQTECVTLDFTKTPPVLVDGHGTVIAANGDQIFIHYTAATAPPDANNQIHPRGSFCIVGGTGHFDGATGQGDLAVDGTANDGETAVFDGTMVVGNGGGAPACT